MINPLPQPRFSLAIHLMKQIPLMSCLLSLVYGASTTGCMVPAVCFDQSTRSVHVPRSCPVCERMAWAVPISSFYFDFHFRLLGFLISLGFPAMSLQSQGR